MFRRTVSFVLSALLVLAPWAAASADTTDPAGGPVLTLEGDAEMTVDANFTFEDPGATARDARGADLTDRITVEGQVIPYVVGEYTLTYTVADDEGREAQATRTVTVVPVALPEVVEPPAKTIYLTFDDGPCYYTEGLLNTLAKYDVKATFFVVGSRGYKDLIQRAYEEGHSIGVHSYTHVYKDIYASEEAFLQDFMATEEVIQEITGQYTHILRFPGGSANTVSSFNPGIMTRLTKIMEDMGYRYFDWTISSGDATHVQHTLWDYHFAILSRLPTDGSPAVVLQHDLNGISVRALDTFIPWALENGYTFLPLDMTSPVIHIPVKN